MTSLSHAPHIIVLNRWSVGWSGGQPPYEDVLDHDAYRVSYIVDAEGLKGLTDRIKASCLVETVTDIKDLEQLATAFEALVEKGGGAFRLVALSEWDLLNAAALRERFGVAGMQPAAVLGVRDKVRMKERIMAAGIKAPVFAPCPDLAALEAFIDAHGFPIVLKPRKMAASIGVVILRDQAQLDSEKERRVNLNGTIGLTPAAADALKEFEDALDAVTMKFFLQPGELLVIDNRKTVHGRTAFTPTFGPMARWLQRTYVRSTLWHGRERVGERLNLFS